MNRNQIAILGVSLFFMIVGFQNCDNGFTSEALNRLGTMDSNSSVQASGTMPIESNIWVYILAGQSNMVGRGRLNRIEPSLWRIPDNIRIFEHGVELESFEDREYLGEISFGPELSMAHELARLHPNQEIVIFKHAVGGTEILEWCGTCPLPSDYPANFPHGRHYNQLLNSYKKFKKTHPMFRNKRIIEKGFAWAQGGSDAINGKKTGQATHDLYYQRFSTFIKQVRKDFGYTRQFVFSRIWKYQASKIPLIEEQYHINHIRAAQAKIFRDIKNDPNRHYVQIINTDDSTLNDRYHFDAESLLRVGSCFAESFYYGKRRMLNYCRPQD